MEVMQHARVCFTDIPFDRMAAHGQRYGKYGVGFKRETVIDWGGLPVWYLPNYWSDTTLKLAGPTLVNSLHAAMQTADQFRAVIKVLSDNNISVTSNYTHGSPVDSAQLVTQMQQVNDAVYAVLSFIKEMSPSNVEDCSYLLEREWRIVSAIQFQHQPNTYRELTNPEKQMLCKKNPKWQKRRQSEDINISSRYAPASIIDSFRFFNGLPNQMTVAQGIDSILVPDEPEATWVQGFLDEHAAVFMTSAPRVVVFPSV